MFTFKVGEKEYKVKFGYRVLCKTDLIDRFSSASQSDSFRDSMDIVWEMLLAGLQKHHKDEFKYETESEKEESLEKIYELMDEYEDESTEENPQDAFTLFEKMQEELFKNGFLSKVMENAKAAAEKVDSTVMPQGHKKKA